MPLYFMRSTSCPVCNGHVRDLAGRSTELAAANVRVLIDTEGRIRHAHGATMPVGSYDRKGVLLAITELASSPRH